MKLKSNLRVLRKGYYMYLSFFEGISITPEFSGQITYPVNAVVFGGARIELATPFKQKIYPYKMFAQQYFSFTDIVYILI